MKRNIIQFMVIGAMATAMLASCNKNKETEANVPENGFLATIEANQGNGSRTHLDGNDVLWNAGDQIVVRNGNGDAATYTLTDGEGTTSGTFYSGEDGDDFFQPSYTAIYPAAEGNSITGEGMATFTLPATQSYVANSFANGAMPMMAVSDDQTLAFKNVLGGICFPMTGDGVTVTRLVLTSNNASDNLSGVFSANYNNGQPTLAYTSGGANSITLDCGAGVTLDATTATDFTIMVPAGSLASGFTLQAFDGTTMVFEKSNTASLGADFIPRSVIRKVNSNLEVVESQFTGLTFEAKAANSTVTFTADDITPAITMEYSTDGITWNAYTSGTEITMAEVGDKVMFRGDNTTLKSMGESVGSHFYNTGECYVYGNVMSLLDKENYATAITVTSCAFEFLFAGNQAIYNHPEHPIELPATTLADHCYYGMFFGCTSLTTAPELPATTLADYCYAGMFFGCTSLTTAPELPATTLEDYCYAGMFGDCTSLETAPGLPATTLAEGCYQGMFRDCTSLTTAPELPATTMADYCYNDMFFGCTSLTTAPELPATTMADHCYGGMFSGCTSLKTAPALPATTLANYCYYFMFDGCTNLTSAPELPATTMEDACYAFMFEGCTSLTTAPELPATTLATTCYNEMFAGCTSLTTAPRRLPATTLANKCCVFMFVNCSSLTTAPELPATTLATECYRGMFSGCTSLTAAPELPATTLVQGCYDIMFAGCTNLNYIKCLATDISASHCTYFWVDGVSSTGTFVKNPSMTSWTTGINGIPTGWTVR